MSKRLLIFVAGALLACPAMAAPKGAPAILERNDGRAWRVMLQRIEKGQVVVRLENASGERLFKVEDIKRLQLSHAPLDLKAAQASFDSADYGKTIQLLEPVTAPYRPFVAISNNLEDEFILLLRAYERNGNASQAVDLAQQLSVSPNPKVGDVARVMTALGAIRQNDLVKAEEIRAGLNESPAGLYIQASIERARGEPQKAIQTAIRLIADHGNDMDWMPRTELLCAALYNDMGMEDSAASTARQTAAFYKGTGIGKEAERFLAELSTH